MIRFDALSGLGLELVWNIELSWFTLLGRDEIKRTVFLAVCTVAGGFAARFLAFGESPADQRGSGEELGEAGPELAFLGCHSGFGDI